ncbi:hypothetical protein PL418_02535 [Barnesiella intestinihominis]|uniref:hypothetical protein n=1 Tax=Barnesiella intestinihominis TaxID=487174 RepID=UPI001E3ADD2E|nr:hypothetical protein [Barnesiella intestinihominis]MDB0680451.1 hypothetical protein [Barnesiella intestinihominis]
MKAKLKIIKDWEFGRIELSGTSFKYSPLGGKGMIARSEEEIVFSVYHSQQKSKGVLWIKGDISRFIPSPPPRSARHLARPRTFILQQRNIISLWSQQNSLVVI